MFRPGALLMVIFLTACGPNSREQIAAAAKARAQIEAAQSWPDLPSDCRRVSRSGVQAGDRLDVALLKTDAALSRQNARTRRCADWFDGVRPVVTGGVSGVR